MLACIKFRAKWQNFLFANCATKSFIQSRPSLTSLPDDRDIVPRAKLDLHCKNIIHPRLERIQIQHTEVTKHDTFHDLKYCNETVTCKNCIFCKLFLNTENKVKPQNYIRHLFSAFSLESEPGMPPRKGKKRKGTFAIQRFFIHKRH